MPEPIQVYQLDVLYYTRKKPEKIIVGSLDLGKEVTRLMADGKVQFVHIRRYRGDDKKKGGDNKP